MEPTPRRRSLLVGTAAALVALLAAGATAVAWQAFVDDDPAPATEMDLRFTAEDDESSSLVGEDPTGDIVPDDPFPLLDEGLASLADYRGRPLVLNFFGSACEPCRAEMPAFESVHDDVGDQVVFLGLAENDSARSAQAFVDETGVSYEIGRDPSGKLFTELEALALPSTYLVSPEGHVVASHAGALSADELRALIDQHLLS